MLFKGEYQSSDGGDRVVRDRELVLANAKAAVGLTCFLGVSRLEPQCSLLEGSDCRRSNDI